MLTFIPQSDKVVGMWKEFKSKTKTSGYVSVECCTQCNFWAPPWLNTKINPPPTCAFCPDCGGDIQQYVGQYQYTDRETKWFGLVTTKEKVYLDFIRKDSGGEKLGNMLDEIGEKLSNNLDELQDGRSATKSITKLEQGVHRTHCCVVHGCKYGHPECPVVFDDLKQDYVCEECSEVEGWTTVEQVHQAAKQGKWDFPLPTFEDYHHPEPDGNHPYEAAAIMQDRIDSELEALAEEQGKAGKSFRKYQQNLIHCTMDKLHLIEDCKVIYDIHYAFAGIGIVFYYSERDNGDYRSGLAVEAYYETFEECINAEVKIVIDDMLKSS